jgi:lysophospholipid acyltransferase (LPLAT)-like uncharacterized protein
MTGGSYRVQTLKKWWQRLLVVIFVWFLKLYWSTLRIRISLKTKKTIDLIEAPAIFAFWHSNLFVAYPLKKTLTQSPMIYGLVSPSRDGAWLAEIFRLLNVVAIRGSSKRGGIAAIADMSAKLTEGAFVAITPDGPRGPVHKFKPGIAMLAKQSNADVALVATKYNRHTTLSTWDRFKIPFPFSKVDVNVRVFPNEDFCNLSPEAVTGMLEKELNSMTSELEKAHQSHGHDRTHV